MVKNGDQDNQVQVVASFEACPWCGSTRRMMGELGKEMKEQGLIGEDMQVGLAEIGGPLVDPRKQLLTASIRPGMFALRDICIGCGREITVRIEKKPFKVGMVPMPGVGGSALPGQGMGGMR